MLMINWPLGKPDRVLIVGRPDSLERDYGIRAEAGQTLALTIFDGSDSYQRSFTVGAVLDQRKIGGNSDKIDMLMLPVDPYRRG